MTIFPVYQTGILGFPACPKLRFSEMFPLANRRSFKGGEAGVLRFAVEVLPPQLDTIAGSTDCIYLPEY